MMKGRRRVINSGVVYSTEHGRMCSVCGEPVNRCVCKNTKNIFPGDGIVRVGRSTKGRRGKFVTVITGIALDRDKLQGIGKGLKEKCGTGGTVKNGIIEIQGDHREILVKELEKMGFMVKLAGG